MPQVIQPNKMFALNVVHRHVEEAKKYDDQIPPVPGHNQ